VCLTFPFDVYRLVAGQFVSDVSEEKERRHCQRSAGQRKGADCWAEVVLCCRIALLGQILERCEGG
jgi:hypothetical protein